MELVPGQLLFDRLSGVVLHRQPQNRTRNIVKLDSYQVWLSIRYSVYPLSKQPHRDI